MRLTREQRFFLVDAWDGDGRRKRGGAYALGSVRANTGGARRRMMLRLIAAGYLDNEWPWRITAAGRRALKEAKDEH